MKLWPLAYYAIATFTVVALMLVLSHLLGERHAAPRRDEPYESGMPTRGPGDAPFRAQFYLVAAFFVVFDIETLFLLAWAVAAPRLGWPGFASAMLFSGVLLLGLAYIWRCGELDWGPR